MYPSFPVRFIERIWHSASLVRSSAWVSEAKKQKSFFTQSHHQTFVDFTKYVRKTMFMPTSFPPLANAYGTWRGKSTTDYAVVGGNEIASQAPLVKRTKMTSVLSLLLGFRRA